MGRESSSPDPGHGFNWNNISMNKCKVNKNIFFFSVTTNN